MPNEEQKKKLLNIWEQVEKNKEDILSFLYGNKTLAEFGIKVIGVLESSEELPDADTYEGDFGDAFAVGEESPYDYYVFTREGADGVVGFWLNIGEFPKAGPQGEPGEQGEQGPQGERGPTGSTGPRGATGQTGPQGEQGIQGIQGERGPQGEQGEPGTFFHIRGKVASADLLPAAADVDDQAAYLVGADAPYDVYCIMDVSGTHYWVNLGPVAVQESDTKVGSLTFAASGTLSAEVLNALVNTTTADFLKIGDRYFVKQSTGHYYALKRDSGEMLVYACDIDLVTGEWTITTETMVDLDSAQTITGVKTFSDIVKFTSNLANGDGVNALRFFGSYIRSYLNIVASADNSKDLGSLAIRWKDGYFAGQVYAENTFNVINASDIVNSTLTQAQLDIITNGKPTLIKGTLLGITDILLHGSIIRGSTNLYIKYIGGVGTNNIAEGLLKIVISSKAISIANDLYIALANIGYFNSKSIPDYPTANASPQVLTIGANGGALNWSGIYRHLISISKTTLGLSVQFEILSSSNSQIDTYAKLLSALADDASYIASGIYGLSTDKFIVQEVSRVTTSIGLIGIKQDFTFGIVTLSESDITTISDAVLSII